MLCVCGQIDVGVFAVVLTMICCNAPAPACWASGAQLIRCCGKNAHRTMVLTIILGTRGRSRVPRKVEECLREYHIGCCIYSVCKFGLVNTLFSLKIFNAGNACN